MLPQVVALLEAELEYQDAVLGVNANNKDTVDTMIKGCGVKADVNELHVAALCIRRVSLDMVEAQLQPAWRRVLWVPYFALGFCVRGALIRFMWTAFVYPTFGVAAPSMTACFGLGMLSVYMVNGAGMPSRSKTAMEQLRTYPVEQQLFNLCLFSALEIALAWCVSLFV